MLPAYHLTDRDLAMGPSFGNSAIWVTTKGTGALERIFNARVGRSCFGSVSVRYALASQSLEGVTPSPDDGSSAVPIRAVGAIAVELHPAYQRRRFTLLDGVDVSETTFVPLTDLASPGGDPPAAYVDVELRNAGALARTLRIVGFAGLRGTLPADVRARYDAGLGAIVAWNPGVAAATRCFGATRAVTHHAVTADAGRVYDPSQLRSLDDDASSSGDVLGALQLDVALAPGASVRFAFVCAAFDAPEPAAAERYRALPEPAAALATTVAHLEDVLAVAEVGTPDRKINDGALWSKTNMRRVMSSYAGGRAFTNEPGVSSNVVGRDAAWFVYGNDHFQPAFSRDLLDKFAAVQYPSGKIPEYYSALDEHVEDDGLNINDDTPLFVLAVNHHVRATGDRAWLRAIYPHVARAARYILEQIDARGLVFCSARDERGNVWAIAGWRNVIPGYTLNGAVTEINAECAAALRAAGHLAENLGSSGSDAADFARESRRIAAAMAEHLIDPATGLFYLNVDADGVVHSDVTGDEIFPVMFRTCDEETGFRVIRRLNARDFWTAGGLRTVSQDDPLYDPSGNVGLLGGVWPGLTWWYAFAAARYHPEFMVRALGASFEHYAVDPRTNNTVPGQFGEYFDGESLINRGMRLSPWEPPRFLWAAIEGVCGVMVAPGSLRVAPLIPPTWKWVALKRLPYHGAEITYFVARHAGELRLYAAGDVACELATERYDRDVSRAVAVSPEASVVALERAGSIVVFVGSHDDATRTFAVELGALLEPGAEYEVRTFDSERDAWSEGRARVASGSLCLPIEPGGYRLVELVPA